MEGNVEGNIFLSGDAYELLREFRSHRFIELLPIALGLRELLEKGLVARVSAAEINGVYTLTDLGVTQAVGTIRKT